MASSYLGIVIAHVTIPESAALVIGRMFGKHNFSYFISPKKTIEGLIGQFAGVAVSVFTIVVIMGVFGFSRVGFSVFDYFVQGLAIIPIAIVGDLMESILKRAINVKDSSESNVIGKGLGGILDKFDSFGVAWMFYPILIKFLRPQHYPL